MSAGDSPGGFSRYIGAQTPFGAAPGKTWRGLAVRCNPPRNRTMHTAADHPHYYHAQDLPRFGEIGRDAPELAEKFFAWYNAVFAEGALTAREKSLIALAVAHAVQCPYCIDAYSGDCLQKGADTEQMTEAVHVAAAIRGGASLVHGIQMRNHADRLGM